MNRKKHNLTTHEEIVQKAAKLFSQRGYFGVSMQDIAYELEITKAALYYHFPSKENLYREILQTTFADLWKTLKTAFLKAEAPWDKLFNVIESYLLFSLSRPEVNLFFREDLPENDRETLKVVYSMRSRILTFFKELIKAEAKGRKLAGREIILLTSLLLTLLGKSIMIATFPPRILAEQIVKLLFPKTATRHYPRRHKSSGQIIFSHA